MRILGSFRKSASGSFAIAAGIAMVPMVLSVGFAVDYTALLQEQNRMQQIADGASLALASSSRNADQTTMRQTAQRYITANAEGNPGAPITLDSVTAAGSDVTVTLGSKVPTNFMSVVGYPEIQLNATAIATRAVQGSVEVSLVLDNTWSMIDIDAKGVSKIAALKSAAATLVDELFSNDGANVRVAVVPYADYVNVGTANRGASWLSVPADSSKTTPQTCKDVTSEQVCTKYKPSYSCSTTTDGVTTTGTCSGGCESDGWVTKTYNPPKRSCTGGVTSNYTWYGCVGSRKVNSIRLADGNPSTPYPGYTATSQRCPAPILPLTDVKQAILTRIGQMTPNVGSYKPMTYIPAGLMWGLNVLSPTEPFSEGAAYDSDNIKPRKVLVLMTDGNNTLRYNAIAIGKDSADGKVNYVDGTSALNWLPTANGLLQLAQTNADTRTLCANIKNSDRNIEIFSVALMVDNDEAKNILQGCASNSAGTLDHYYSADDADALASAFAGIAQKLTLVRLKK